MKKSAFRTLLAIAAAGLLLASCKDENDDGNTSKTTYEFSVGADDNPIAAPAEGKVYTLRVTSTKTAQAGTSAVAYEVVSSPEWAPAGIEQTALVITVAPNSSTEARNPDKIVLRQEESDLELEITVEQAGFAYALSLDAAYKTDRCKVLTITPAVTGFDANPVYAWTVQGPGEGNPVEAGSDRTLSFIRLATGDYQVALTVTDDSGIRMSASTTVTVTTETEAYSPYLSEVLEYRPALLNDKGLQFGPVDTYTTALEKVSTALKGKAFSQSDQGVCVGSFGSYIVFRFDHTVMNASGVRDFRIGSFATKTSYPAQGVVWVAFDRNGNGQPDADEWYEIAGSEYGKTTTRTGLKVVYTRPGDLAPDEQVEEWALCTINDTEKNNYCYALPPWGGSSYTNWPAYLAKSDEGAQLTYTDVVMLPPLATAPSSPSGYPTAATRWYDYGYVCNSDPTDVAGSSFDIDWAVDRKGAKVHLPGVDFVKVQSATLQDMGYWYGPSCLMINSATDLHIDGSDPVPTVE